MRSYRVHGLVLFSIIRVYLWSYRVIAVLHLGFGLWCSCGLGFRV